MKSKRFILVILLAAILGVGIWWFMRPTVAAPEKTAGAPMLVKSDGPALSKAEAPKQVAPPGPKPGVAPIAATQPIATPDAEPNADSQAELKTAFADIARLWRAGDLAAFQLAYTPPDELDPQRIQQLQASERAGAAKPPPQSDMQRMNEAQAQAYEALENQTPTLNDAGDEATYIFMRPQFTTSGRSVVIEGKQVPKVFVKINGKWYIKNGVWN